MELEHRAASVCAPLTLRAGIASGYALLFEGDDYIGSAVNMAARLCDDATGLRGADPDDAPRSAAARRTAEPYGEIELRGFPGTIDVVDCEGAPTEVRHDTGELWTHNPFV